MCFFKGNFNWGLLRKNQSPNKLCLLLSLTPLLILRDEVGGLFSRQIDHNVESVSVHHWELHQAVSGIICIAYEADVYKWKVNV
ncbi:hypothetical protein SDJN03_30099, partial [Cucurbita argyrosperma subsp. sororia]